MSIPTLNELSQACYAIISRMEHDLQSLREGRIMIHCGDEEVTPEIVAQLAGGLSDLRLAIGELVAGSGNSAAVRTEAASE